MSPWCSASLRFQHTTPSSCTPPNATAHSTGSPVSGPTPRTLLVLGAWSASALRSTARWTPTSAATFFWRYQRAEWVSHLPIIGYTSSSPSTSGPPTTPTKCGAPPSTASSPPSGGFIRYNPATHPISASDARPILWTTTSPHATSATSPPYPPPHQSTYHPTGHTSWPSPCRFRRSLTHTPR